MSALAVVSERWPFKPGAQHVEIPKMNRAGLAELFHELGFKIGVEVGVDRGKNARRFCRRIPGVKLYCVDSWAAGNAAHRDEAVERLAGCDVEFIDAPSLEAVKQFEDGSLDFVYIDGDHVVDQVVADLTAWAPKVKREGIVAGHDYRRGGWHMHVVEAVNAYVYAWGIRPLFLAGEKADARRESFRSWFFCRESDSRTAL